MSQVNFFKGHPSNYLLPTDAILKATESLLTRNRPEDNDNEDRHPLTYGSDPGSLKVRKQLAEWMPVASQEVLFAKTYASKMYESGLMNKSNAENDNNTNRDVSFSADKKSGSRVTATSSSNTALSLNISQMGTEIDPNSINLTNGASYGAMNALLQLTLPHERSGTGSRTRRAFILSPTYFLINSVFLDAGFAGKVDAITQDPHTGKLDFVEFERLLVYYMQQDVDPVDTDQIDAYNKEKKTQSGAPNHSQSRSVNSVTDDSSRPVPRKIYTFVMYLVPTFSNPTGCTMSLADRLKLIDIARKYDILLLCDDVYDLLDFRAFNLGVGVGVGGSVSTATTNNSSDVTSENKHTSDSSNQNIDLDTLLPPRLVTLDRWTLYSDENNRVREPNDCFGNTISNLTFSKLLGPGLRVGWQETVSPALAQNQLACSGAVRSGGTPSHYTSTLVGELLSLGLVDPIIRNLCGVYASRAKVLASSVREYLPPQTRIYGGNGGYFFWIEVPVQVKSDKTNNGHIADTLSAGAAATTKKLDADIIAQKCALLGNVVLAPGSAFEVVGKPHGWNKNCFRLSVSYHSEDEIRFGIKLFGQVLNGLLNGSIPF